MSTKDAPLSIFYCPHNGKIVDKDYPNAIEYVRRENRPVHNWQEDQPHHIPEFNGHADHDLIDVIPTRE
jgi:hypothetical protein